LQIYLMNTNLRTSSSLVAWANISLKNTWYVNLYFGEFWIVIVIALACFKI
jgi:hypothetical protein